MMKLLHLRIACCLYNQITDYDNEYLKFSKQYPNLDLSKSGHIQGLIKWLRTWGCRQFKKESEKVSIKSIKEWYKPIKSKIRNFNTPLIEFGLNENKSLIIEIFDDLVKSKAATRQVKGRESEVSIGPVGAAKILFALRPSLYAPWDTLIYKKLKLKGNGSGYIDYLEKVQEALKSIKHDIKDAGISWDQLFKYLKKKHNSYPKLIDEYYWVTITRGCDPSEIEKIFQSAPNY